MPSTGETERTALKRIAEHKADVSRGNGNNGVAVHVKHQSRLWPAIRFNLKTNSKCPDCVTIAPWKTGHILV